MINSLSLLVAVLVSLQCTFEASALDGRNVMNNNMQPNKAVPTTRRRLGNVVHIDKAPPSTVEMEPGTQLVLKCKVLGRPMPSVHWLKNGEPIVYEDQPNDIFTADLPNAAYLVSKLVVTSAVSGDVFTCVATSGAKSESASTTVFTELDEEQNLLTLQKLFRMPSKPIITTYYTDVIQTIGTDLLLPCRVSSYTKSQVFWQYNEENIYGDSRLQMLPTGDLLITDLRFADMGNFTCIAKNMYGKDIANTFVYPNKAS